MKKNKFHLILIHKSAQQIFCSLQFPWLRYRWSMSAININLYDRFESPMFSNNIYIFDKVSNIEVIPISCDARQNLIFFSIHSTIFRMMIILLYRSLLKSKSIFAVELFFFCNITTRILGSVTNLLNNIAVSSTCASNHNKARKCHPQKSIKH